jgi:hypothetical protein
MKNILLKSLKRQYRKQQGGIAMIKKVLLCLAILIACTQFNSCGKETDGIPPAIQKLIDDDVRFTQGCADCAELYQVDEYYYNGERVFLCITSGGGWGAAKSVAIRTSEGFAIAGWSNYDAPQYTWGCAEHFLQNSQYIRNLWFKWQ